MSSSKSKSGDKKGLYGRHSASTVARLEAMFREYPNPDESRRRQMSEELGLEPRQVKFWYQNKKTQVKNQNKRLQCNALRVENEKLLSENLKMRETLRDSICISCGDHRDSRIKERELTLQTLKAENLLIAKEFESKLTLLKNSGINPIELPTLLSLRDPGQGSLTNQTVGIPDQHTPTHDHIIPARNQCIPNHDHHILAPVNGAPVHELHQHFPTLTTPAFQQNILALNPSLHQNNPPLISSSNFNITASVTSLGPNIHTMNQAIPPLGQNISALGHNKMPSPYLDLKAILGIMNNHQLPQPVTSQTIDMENAQMWQIANNAMEELLKLLSINEPFWFKSLHDGKFILQNDMYQRTFGRSSHLNGTHARVESSKDSLLVNMGGAQLVEMFLNPDKWVDLFPTIVKKAQTIQVFESGMIGNQNMALQMMNAEMHILSNLVPTREFFFLRYCKKFQEGVWVIGDVSVDFSKYKTTVSGTWRLPSGCLIQEINQGLCRVTWVERVEVDDKIQTHELFRDVICQNNAYGAERWVLTLQRMCERFACASVETIPNCDAGGVITSPEGRKNVMNLAHRIVKNFLRNLDMQDNGNYPHLTRMINNGEVKLSIRVNNTEPGVPKGMIFSAATSFWLPLSPQDIFDILMDMKKRAKWDVLCNGIPGNEIQRISTGSKSGNCISVIWPFIPTENNIMILQESYADASGFMLVYTALDMRVLNLAFKGEDMSLLPLLPSGITISLDGKSNVPQGQPRGSLVTIMSQVLAASPSQMDTIGKKFVSALNTHVTATAEKIKATLL